MTIVGAAQAHERGDFIVRLGVAGTSVNSDFPDYYSLVVAQEIGIPESAVRLKEKNDTQPFLNFTYMPLDKLGIDVMVSTGYKNNLRFGYAGNDPLVAEDLSGLGNVYEFKQQPFMLGATYYPRGTAAARVHPYLGVGGVYTRAEMRLHGDAVAWALENGLGNEADLESLNDDAADSVRNDNWGGYAQLGADINLTGELFLNTQVRYNYAASDFKYWNYMVSLGYKF